MITVSYRLCAVVLGIALSACGGGGGGSNDDLGGRAKASISPSTVNATVTNLAAGNHPETLTITISDVPPNGVHTMGTFSKNGIESVVVVPNGVGSAYLRIEFKNGRALGEGTYQDQIEVKVCRDEQCKEPIVGSPLLVTTHFTVTNAVQPEPGLTALTITGQQALPHDVIDAEFSKSLNAVVMVSNWPKPALYLYDASTGSEFQLALNKPPKAVSISPDGYTAAVGHDGLITHIDLRTITPPAEGLPKRLNVSAEVGDLVLDGRGYVHAFPAIDQWVDVHSINVASGTEVLSRGPRAGSKVRLHPDGNRIYAANNGISPDDIESYDISGGTALRLGDSPYHGDYPMCGALWIGESGAHIYTACGRVFRSSVLRAEDMIYTGTLPLGSSTASTSYRIVSLSDSLPYKELAVLEESWSDCRASPASPNCYSHLNLYNSEFLTRQAQYTMPPVKVDGKTYVQSGVFVAHRSDGKLLLISRLRGIPNAASEYYIGTVTQDRATP